MEDSKNDKLLQTKFLLAFLVLQIVFIVGAAIMIVVQLNKTNKVDENDYSSKPSVEIENLAENIIDIPEERKDFIQIQLLSIMRNNNSDLNLRDAKAEIRKGSVREHYFELINVNFTSAIVDVPELEQSYRVFLQSSDDEYNRYLDPNGTIVFLCLNDLENVIYADFDCIDTYSQKTYNSLVTQFLKYYQFDGFSAWVNNFENVVIVPDDFGNVDEEMFILQTKEAIESMGISPELFNYRIMQTEEYDFKINR